MRTGRHVSRPVKRVRARVLAIVGASGLAMVTTSAVAAQDLAVDPPPATAPAAAVAPVLPPPAAPPVAVAPAVEPAPAVPSVAEIAAVLRRAPVGRPADYAGEIRSAGIVAVAAYQRAETVINATVDCNLDWTVLAAIARVESDHGRGDGEHRVTSTGRVIPAYVGAPLDGSEGGDRLHDTDGGELDGHPRWDAPVGPFGFLPTVWSSVAVDADGDKLRDPQDVDDAALAAAVFLCSGGRDLSRVGQLQQALGEYHPAQRFSGTVVSLAQVYQEQEAVRPMPLPPITITIPLDMPEMCQCSSTRARGIGGRDADEADDRGGRRDEEPTTSGKASGKGGKSLKGVKDVQGGKTGVVEAPVEPAGPPADPVDPPAGPGTDPVEPPAEPPVDPVEPPAHPPVDPVEPPAEPPADPVDPPAAKPEPEPATKPEEGPAESCDEQPDTATEEDIAAGTCTDPESAGGDPTSGEGVPAAPPE